MSKHKKQAKTHIILVVEADAEIGSFLLEAFAQKASYQMVLLTHSLPALQVAEEIKPDLFILNYDLPQANGVELYDRLHAVKGLEDVPAIMVSAYLPEQELKRRKIVGIKTPVEVDEFLDVIQKALA